MTPRRLLPAPALLTAVLVTASLLSVASAAGASPGTVAGVSPTAVGATSPDGVVSAKKRAPRHDFPRMPRKCATPQQKVPHKPVVCKLTRFDANRPSVMLWGDSHAWMLMPALRRAVKGERVNLVAVVMGSCPPMNNRVRPRERALPCFRSNAFGIRFARRVQRSGENLRIVLVGSWERYAREIRRNPESYAGFMAKEMIKATPRLMRTLGRMPLGVDVVGQIATVPARTPSCRAGNNPYACDVPRRKALKREAATRSWLVDTIKPLRGNRAPIEVNGRFCDARVCHGKVRRLYTWWDDLHLSATMSRKLVPYFDEVVDKALGRRTRPQESGQADPGDQAGSGDPGCIVAILC